DVRACDDEAHAASGVAHADRRSDRRRSRSAGDLHADGRFPPRLPRLRREAEAGFRGELTTVATRSFLDWPFFTGAHKELAERVNAWAEKRFAGGGPHAEDRESVDVACRQLVRDLGRAGWTQYSAPASRDGAPPSFDVRALALIRETLAWYDGLADFAFAMQGLGSGAISLAGSSELRQRYLPKVAAGDSI